MRTKRARVSAIVVAALALALGPFVLWQGAVGGSNADPAPGGGIVVVGDSITARYDDTPGSPHQGWWSMVGRHEGMRVDTYAQSGSGYLRRGGLCDGTVFGDRDAALSGPPPAVFIIEGGRNDWAVCREDRVQIAGNDEVRAAVARYLDRVDRAMPPSTRVVVLGPPWGPVQPLDGLRITSIVRDEAQQHGFEFVDTTGTLPRQHVVDGIHPNRAGSIAIARRVVAVLD